MVVDCYLMHANCPTHGCLLRPWLKFISKFFEPHDLFFYKASKEYNPLKHLYFDTILRVAWVLLNAFHLIVTGARFK